MTQLTIRNIEKQLHSALKQEASRKNTSMNRLVVHILKEAMGLEKTEMKRTYHDLDHLAGTWSEDEFKAFEKAMEPFDQIDEDMWQ
ncbi:MAG: antitoxin [Chloroflexota bacterium]